MTMRKFIDLTEAAFVGPQKYIAQGKVDVIGDGLWSNTPMKNLQVHILPKDVFWFNKLDQAGRPSLVGNLNVYFDQKVWDVNTFGLIYTDSLFEKGVRALLRAAGFKFWMDVDYSEQGMQGNDFVNFDVGKKLASELDEKGFIEVTRYEDWKWQ